MNEQSEQSGTATTPKQRGKRGSKGNGNGGESGGAPSGAQQSVVATVLASVAGQIGTLKSERERLMTQRTAIQQSLEQQIATIDEQIGQVDSGLSQLGETVPSRRGRPRGSTNAKRGPGRPRGSKNKPSGRKAKGGGKRAQNEGNLPQAISQLFDHAGPLGLPEIIEQVQQAPVNYKTTSGDGFRSIVQQAFTKHLVHFGRDGNPKTNKDGEAVSKRGLTGMFVRLGRGVYGNFQKGDTVEKIEARAAKIEKAASAE